MSRRHSKSPRPVKNAVRAYESIFHVNPHKCLENLVIFPLAVMDDETIPVNKYPCNFINTKAFHSLRILASLLLLLKWGWRSNKNGPVTVGFAPVCCAQPTAIHVGPLRGQQRLDSAYLKGRLNLVRKNFALGLFALISSIFAGSLFAADATIYTGIQNPGKLTVGNVVQDTKLGAVVGGRISGGKVIGFEETFAYSPNFLESGNRAFNAQSNLVLGIPTGHVTPYGTVGVGLISTWGRQFELEDFGTKFTVNYGGGLKIHNLAGPLGIRFDVRGYTVPKVFNQTLNFVEATVGLMFSW